MTDLSADHIIEVHATIFAISHEAARDRVHDAEGLEAAAIRPANYRHYRGADVALQAAALAHAIAERQVFIDGNKRTALSLMRSFLALNGHTTSASKDELFDWMIRLAHGWGPDQLGDAIRGTLVSLDVWPVDAPTQPHARNRPRARTVSEHIRRGREL